MGRSARAAARGPQGRASHRSHPLCGRCASGPAARGARLRAPAGRPRPSAGRSTRTCLLYTSPSPRD
eukprot:6877896-Alexandrium_andersonii.AAC.1